MGGESSVLGVVIAVVSVIGSIVVARISNPRGDPDEPAAPETSPEEVLRVSPEIWQRLTSLERRVDEQRAQLSTLDRLLYLALRTLHRANRRLRAAGLPAEEPPAELATYTHE